MSGQTPEFRRAQTSEQADETARLAEKYRKRLLAIAAGLVALIALLVIAIVVQFINNRQIVNEVSTNAQQAEDLTKIAQAQIDANKQKIESIVQADLKECYDERQGRVQGKVRAQAIQHLAKHLIRLIAASPVSDIDPEGSQAAIDQFRADLKRIYILPVPDCEKAAEELRDELGGGKRARSKPERKPESKAVSESNGIPRPEAQRTLVPIAPAATTVSQPEGAAPNASSPSDPIDTPPAGNSTQSNPPPQTPPMPQAPDPPPPEGGLGPTLDQSLDTLCGVANVDCSMIPEVPLP